MSARVPAGLAVGYAERGRVIALNVGQHLVVTLGDGWAAPSARSVASDPGPSLQPLLTEEAVGYPEGPARATFLAVRPGVGLVSAQTDGACVRSTPPCAMPREVFEFSVHVTPVPGTGSGPLPRPPAA
jgi:hypothetical protein